MPFCEEGIMPVFFVAMHGFISAQMCPPYCVPPIRCIVCYHHDPAPSFQDPCSLLEEVGHVCEMLKQVFCIDLVKCVVIVWKLFLVYIALLYAVPARVKVNEVCPVCVVSASHIQDSFNNNTIF